MLKTLLFTVLMLTYLNAQTVYEFLRLETSPRVGALANSFTSNVDDPDVVFSNPAGTALLENTPVSFSFVKHLLDVNIASLSLSHNVEGIGRFSGGIKYAGYGSFEGADKFGNKTGEYSASDMLIHVAYANKLGDNFYYGVGTKFIYSSLASYSSTAAAADFGLTYANVDRDMSVGFSILNVGGQLSTYGSTSEDLPVDVSLGISKKLQIPITLFLDFHNLNEDTDSFFKRFNHFTFGAEIAVSKSLDFRFGYDNQKRTDLKIADFAGLAGFNAGFGLDIGSYTFNYGFSSWGEVGTLHRLGLSTTIK